MSDTLPIGSIVVGKRHRRTFGNLESLAASIDELGVLHPPVVRPVGDKYELVAGERSLRDMRLLDRKSTRLNSSHRKLYRMPSSA